MASYVSMIVPPWSFARAAGKPPLPVSSGCGDVGASFDQSDDTLKSMALNAAASDFQTI
jgi:hypothetical protein